MMDQQLDKIESYPYQDYIIIPIRKEVLKLFDSDKILFQMSIVDNEIRLTSPKIKAKLGSLSNQPLVKMEVSNIVKTH